MSESPGARRRVRERRGRGPRGPAVLPRIPGRPETPTSRERFDDLTLTLVEAFDSRLHDRLGLVEYAVEDAPMLTTDWDGPVPLSTLHRGSGADGARIVLFRRPIESRASTRVELELLLRSLLAERLGELLGVDPEDIDPAYRPD